MKTINRKFCSWVAYSVLATCLSILPACITQPAPQTPEQVAERRERRAKRIVEMATYDVALVELKGRENTPSNRAKFSAITNQLSSFLSVTNITSNDISAYVSSLPIGALKTIEGQIIAGGVLIVVDEVVGDKYQITTPAQVKPLIESAMKGFGRAIEFAERNPYEPPTAKPAKVKITP